MPTKKPLTVNLAVEIDERLDQPTASPRHDETRLPAEAVANHVDREAAIIEGIEAGLADMRVARVVGHDEAMARINRTIMAVKTRNDLTAPRRD